MKRATVGSPTTSRGRRFLQELTDRLSDPWDRPSPHDPRFGDLKQEIRCQSSPSKLALLEAAATTLRAGETYLEIGAHTGASAIAAARSRDDIRLITVDDFSQDGSIPERLRENLERYGVDDRIQVIEGDCFDVLRGSLPPIGVYFFDGPHRYIDHYLALELAMEHLTDEAIVIVDDTRWAHVARADLDFARSHPRFHLLCDFPAQSLRDPYWWNGLHVFEYVADAPRGGRDLIFQLNRARDEILRPMTLLERWHASRASLVRTWRRLSRRFIRRHEARS